MKQGVGNFRSDREVDDLFLLRGSTRSRTGTRPSVDQLDGLGLGIDRCLGSGRARCYNRMISLGRWIGDSGARRLTHSRRLLDTWSIIDRVVGGSISNHCTYDCISIPLGGGHGLGRRNEYGNIKDT